MSAEYKEFIGRMAAEAARAADSAEVPRDFAWLPGGWNRDGNPVHFAATPYGISREAEPFLIYNAASNMWLLILTEPDSYGMLIGRGPRAGSTRFTGEVAMHGDPVRLRQTWRFIDDRAVEIENERMAGRLWQRWDCTRLTRISEPDCPAVIAAPVSRTISPLPPVTPD